jgi:tRNA pseudouridine38-40 synthase
MRFKLTIEYDGGPFQGWQRLPNAPSVQGALEDAVEKLTGVRSDVIGAGRTDSGVHAYAQVAHVDIEKPFEPGRLADALNAHLRPNPIAVSLVEEAASEFHARFDAKLRAYRYRIRNRRTPLTFERGQVWRVSQALDVDAMQAAAAGLVGKHNFTTFRDAHCQAKSPLKTLNVAQVRSMVGTLVEVGIGKMSADDVARVLAAADRAQCGPVAPADGLYLSRVDY